MNHLSIVLPVYNENDSIESVLKEWKQELNKLNIAYSFVVCEDGSTDGTKELLLLLQKKYPLILNQKQKRRGYGSAVIDGITSSSSEYILCVDSDGQCDPKDFFRFWNNKEKAHAIIGWRKKRADPLQRKIFSAIFKTIFVIFFPTTIHDPSAPFVLFKKQNIAPHIKYLTYLREGFWWGFIGMSFKKNLTVHEIPINHRKRIKGKTQVYRTDRLLDIFFRNLFGLYKLKVTR